MRVFSAILFIVLAGRGTEAQVIDFTLTSGSGGPGDLVTLDVLVSTDTPIAGVQCALQHDGAVVQPDSATLGADLAFTPLFEEVNLAPANGPGVIAGVVFPFDPVTLATTLGPATDLEIFNLTYAIDAGAGMGDTDIQFIDGVLGPNPGIQNLVADELGETFAPTTLVDGTISIVLGTPFRRGDCDANGSPALPDVIRLLGVLFSGVIADCEKACDTTDDGQFTLADAISLLSFLFAGGTLPGPLADCGLDPTMDAFTCDMFAGCP